MACVRVPRFALWAAWDHRRRAHAGEHHMSPERLMPLWALAAWRLARGEDGRRPVLGGDALRRAVVAELATPAVGVAPVLAPVRAALERLTAQLAGEGRLAAAVALTLTLDDGRGAHPAGGIARTITRELRLPCPLAAAAPIFSRCRALLERWAPPQPVCGVRVKITATIPPSAQPIGFPSRSETITQTLRVRRE